MTSLAYLHDCHSCYNKRSLVQKKSRHGGSTEWQQSVVFNCRRNILKQLSFEKLDERLRILGVSDLITETKQRMFCLPHVCENSGFFISKGL